MLPAEIAFLEKELIRASRFTEILGKSCRVVNWERLATARLGEPEEHSFWCYYTDPKASEFFDDLMDSGLVHYYARPKEDFYIGDGIAEANAANREFLILEDMS